MGGAGSTLTREEFDRVRTLYEQEKESGAAVDFAPLRSKYLRRTIKLTALLEEIETTVSRGRTPLIVDDSEDHNVDTFFSYRSVSVVDGKKMGLDVSMKKIPVEDVMEGARQKLVAGVKYGCPVIIALTKSVTDFKGKFNDTSSPPREVGTSVFPADLVFRKAGKGLLEEGAMQRLFRQDDREQNLCVCRDPDSFYCAVTTQFSPADFEEYLFGSEGFGLFGDPGLYEFLIVKSSE